jgi:hypothetical protein
MSMRFVGSDDFGVHFCTLEYRHFLDVAPAIANDLAGGEIRQSEMTRMVRANANVRAWR